MVSILRQHKQKEDGFTLLELIIVIVMIGILVSIAVPSLKNQREKASRAAVISDIRNAGMVMEDSLIDNAGKYPAAIPVYNKKSLNSQIELDTSKSGINNFCLVGTHDKYPNISVYYDSLQGGVLPKGGTCVVGAGAGGTAAGGGDTYDDIISGISALVIYDRGGQANRFLTSAGVTDISYNLAPTSIANFVGYDVIVSSSHWWNTPPNIGILLSQAETAGMRVFSDGNDSTEATIALINDTTRYYADGDYTPTGNIQTPAFPAIFSKTELPFLNDAWDCPTSVRAGAVIVADYYDPSTGLTCATIITDVRNGRWAHYAMFSERLTMRAGLLWLMST